MTSKTYTSRLALLALLSFLLGSTSLVAQLSLSFDQQPASCAGYTDGSVSALATGGVEPYTYAWDDNATERVRFGLVDGTYTLTVTDAANASVTESVVVSSPDALTISIDPVGSICDGPNTTYTISATGGTPPYDYFWDNQASPAQVANPTPGGHYALVRDANGCKIGEYIKVPEVLTVNVRTQDVVCYGGCDGTVEAQVSGGEGPFTFLWSTGATDQLLYGLDPGTYTVTVTDGNGCTTVGSGTLSQPDSITVSVSLADSCMGTTVATATASGGTGNLSIRWSNGETGPTATLDEGQWYVYVRDDNNCEVTERVIVSDGIFSVVTMNTDATCDTGGASLLCITGGRGPFTYLWSDGQDSITAVNLAPGTYTYTIIDGGGCTFRGSTVILGPDPADCDDCLAESGTLTGGTTTAEACTPIVLTATVDQAPVVPPGYTTVYLLTGPPNATVLDTSLAPSFTVTDAGTYTIHTLVYDPTTLDLSTLVFGQSMASSIFLQLLQGGGPICGSLDLNGTTFTVPPCNIPCDAVAGTLTGGTTTAEVCDTIRITATVDQAPAVPAGYSVLYVLTAAPSDTLLQVSTTPTFAVTYAGTYTIHTLVYDPTTLDLSTIVFGQTLAADVYGLLIAGGGSICAALDLTGTTFIVPPCVPFACLTDANAPSLASDDVCFDGNTVSLDPTTVTPANVPTGFALVYFLVSLPDGTIIQSGNDPGFDVSAEGTYAVTSLVYDLDSLDLSTLVTLGTTTYTQLSGATTACDAISDLGTTFLVELFEPQFPSSLNADVCPDEPVVLNPTPNPDYTYSWSPATGLDDPDAPSPTATLSADQTYSVTITQLVNGVACSAQRDYTVELAAVPALNVSNDVLACTPDDVDLNANSDAGNQLEWSLESDFSTIANTGGLLTVQPTATATTYYVRASNAAGCVSSSQVTVASEIVDIRVDDNFAICLDDVAELDATVLVGNPVSFDLRDAAGNLVETSTTGAFSFVPTQTERYELIASTANGCQDTTFVTVDVNEVMVDLESDSVAVYPGNEIVLTATAQGTDMYTYTADPSILTTTDNIATAMPDTTTTYEVTVMDSLGCSDVATVTVEVLDFVCDIPYLYVPNAFTPDGDNVNDIFYINGVNVRQAYYAIYNRWGEKVFESNAIGEENGWDGTFNGQLVAPDVYGIFVRIDCRDGDDFFSQGNVTVIR